MGTANEVRLQIQILLFFFLCIGPPKRWHHFQSVNHLALVEKGWWFRCIKKCIQNKKKWFEHPIMQKKNCGTIIWMQFIRIESFTQQGQTVNLILKPPLILIKLASNLTQRNTYFTLQRTFNMFAYNTMQEFILIFKFRNYVMRPWLHDLHLKVFWIATPSGRLSVLSNQENTVSTF